MIELAEDIKSMITWCNALEDTVVDLVDSIGHDWYDVQEYTGLDEFRCRGIISQFEFICKKMRESGEI